MNGVIDIGSNTVRLSVYGEKEDGSLKNIFNKKATLGLAAYVDADGYLSEKGIAETVRVLKDFKHISDSIGLDRLAAFATASVRNVVNSRDVVRAIEEAVGIPVDVLSGEMEAECDFIGAGYRMKLDTGVLADIGGGSTELVFYENGCMKRAFSIPMGSLSLYKKYVSKVFPSRAEMEAIRHHAKERLAQFRGIETDCRSLCGVGGSIRAALKLCNEWSGKEKNREMERKDVSAILLRYLQKPKETMTDIVRILPDRTHTILPGLCILYAILETFQVEEIKVSALGVREGYYLSRLAI